MEVEYHPAARGELRRAARHYEGEPAGLGLAFLAAVRDAEAVLSVHPELGTPLGEANRRHLIRGFPYGLIYRLDEVRIHVLAVTHARRHPDYWRVRE